MKSYVAEFMNQTTKRPHLRRTDPSLGTVQTPGSLPLGMLRAFGGGHCIARPSRIISGNKSGWLGRPLGQTEREYPRAMISGCSLGRLAGLS